MSCPGEPCVVQVKAAGQVSPFRSSCGARDRGRAEAQESGSWPRLVEPEPAAPSRHNCAGGAGNWGRELHILGAKPAQMWRGARRTGAKQGGGSAGPARNGPVRPRRAWSAPPGPLPGPAPFRPRRRARPAAPLGPLRLCPVQVKVATSGLGLRVILRGPDLDCEWRSRGAESPGRRWPLSTTPLQKCSLDLDNIRWDRPDLPCEPRQRRHIPRNLHADETASSPIENHSRPCASWDSAVRGPSGPRSKSTYRGDIELNVVPTQRSADDAAPAQGPGGFIRESYGLGRQQTVGGPPRRWGTTLGLLQAQPLRLAYEASRALRRGGIVCGPLGGNNVEFDVTAVGGL